jgi:dTMP kinase
MAARAQLVDEKISPALKEGKVVICDRYADATVCYQGYGLGVDIDAIDSLNKLVTRSVMPDITFFLDADIRKGLKRSKNVKGFSDRIEKRDYRFHSKVRKGYLMLAKKFPERIKRVDIEHNSKEQTQSLIREILKDVLK